MNNSAFKELFSPPNNLLPNGGSVFRLLADNGEIPSKTDGATLEVNSGTLVNFSESVMIPDSAKGAIIQVQNLAVIVSTVPENVLDAANNLQGFIYQVGDIVVLKSLADLQNLTISTITGAIGNALLYIEFIG